MQAALRAAFQEISRSAATSLLVWAAGRCPDCKPALHCPTIPDCVCQGGGRVREHPGPHWCWLALGGLLLLVLGFLAGRIGRSAEAGLNTTGLRDLARLQALEYRQRRLTNGGIPAGSWSTTG